MGYKKTIASGNCSTPGNWYNFLVGQTHLLESCLTLTPYFRRLWSHPLPYNHPFCTVVHAPSSLQTVSINACHFASMLPIDSWLGASSGGQWEGKTTHNFPTRM